MLASTCLFLLYAELILISYYYSIIIIIIWTVANNSDITEPSHWVCKPAYLVPVSDEGSKFTAATGGKQDLNMADRG